MIEILLFRIRLYFLLQKFPGGRVHADSVVLDQNADPFFRLAFSMDPDPAYLHLLVKRMVNTVFDNRLQGQLGNPKLFLFQIQELFIFQSLPKAQFLQLHVIINILKLILDQHDIRMS